MSIREDQANRILVKLFRVNSKGKRESQIVYEEKRFNQLGEEFTMETLSILLDQGRIISKIEGPKKYKTVSDREKKRVVRYYYVGQANGAN